MPAGDPESPVAGGTVPSTPVASAAAPPPGGVAAGGGCGPSSGASAPGGSAATAAGSPSASGGPAGPAAWHPIGVPPAGVVGGIGSGDHLGRSFAIVGERGTAMAALAGLPDDRDPRYPVAVRELVETLAEPEPMLREILADGLASHQVRFNALYAVLFRLRREERHGDYADLVRANEHEFGDEPYFYTFKAIVASHGASPASLRSAIEYSREATRVLPNVAGVLHQVAVIIVAYYELVAEQPSDTVIDEAQSYVDRAIALSYGEVGHYFETKAMVLALRGDFTSARSTIAEAVELESRSSRDYMRRISEYNTTRVRIDLLAERARWLRSQDDFRSELNRFRSQQFQLLGLLAAVVAFVSSASNIASQTRGSMGLRLMISMSGAVIVVFASFTFLTTRVSTRAIIAVGFGLLLLFFGLNFPSWLVN